MVHRLRNEMMATQRAAIASTNPATEQVVAVFEPHTDPQLAELVEHAHSAYRHWRSVSVDQRAACVGSLASGLRARRRELAELVTLEMGKPIGEALAEVDKCASHCDFFALRASEFLADEATELDGRRAVIQLVPLGCVLGIMPWNFPFWQALRFAVPALVAGNAVVLKHASNVPQCALAIESLIRQAGFPEGLLRTALVAGAGGERLVMHPLVSAVSVTGSSDTGARIAAIAGQQLKKTVLELGGSDPFIVLSDADLARAVEAGCRSRNLNAGQSCIAAKRFLVVDDVADEFSTRLARATAALRVGDPTDPATEVGPLARRDLVDRLDTQVRESVAMGARVLVGGSARVGAGYYYEPTVLADVTRRMPVYEDETFGPVAAVVRVRDTEEAIELANDTRYGLGAAVWTGDPEAGLKLARRIEAGTVTVNGLVASDPRMPFGGIKSSGYGRELSYYGIREFVNVQTVWVSH